VTMTHATLPTPTRCVIADDERLMRDQLRARLAEVWPELEVVAEAKNGNEAVQLVETLHPDLVFLDIRMPGLNGVEAARAIAQLADDDNNDDDHSGQGAANGWPGCQIVFVTAYDEYAVQAFEQGAIDYVLKPAESARLALTVARVQQRLAQRRNAPAEADSTAVPTNLPLLLQKLAAQINPASAPRLRWVQASVGQSIQMIPVDEVLYFISDEKYTRVQTATLEALIRKPIKELLEALDAEQFWQIHRSTVVNAHAVASVTRDERGRQLVSVKGRPEKLEVSRSFAGLFKGM
jgi:DNA-binding LytR/AlgR family response regulator